MLLILTLGATSSAQTGDAGTSGPTPSALAERFLKQVQSGGIDEAFDVLMQGSPLAEQGAQYQLLKSQAVVSLSIVGRALKFERLDENRVGASVVVLKYLMHHQKDAITWTIVFYRPGERWIVTAVKFLPTIQYL